MAEDWSNNAWSNMLEPGDALITLETIRHAIARYRSGHDAYVDERTHSAFTGRPLTDAEKTECATLSHALWDAGGDYWISWRELMRAYDLALGLHFGD